MTLEQIVAAMSGREMTVAAALRAAPGRSQSGRYNESSDRAEVLLEVRQLSATGFTDVSFQLHRGEILGVAGLMGSGRSGLLRSLFGSNPIQAGCILLDGHAVEIPNPLNAIQAGLALLPENRAEEGLFAELSVAKNLVLMKLEEVARGPWLRNERVAAKTERLVKTLNVITYDPHVQLVKQLSGGNQQKVVLGRLLGARPRILLLDEPTRGVDVGTKAEIRRILADFVAQGSGIVMVSSDFSELIGMCDRILVLRRGRLSGFFERGGFQEEYGLNVYAIGGNYQAARLAGLRNQRIITTVFAVQGLLAALGGIVLMARVVSAQPALMHDTNLDVIAAVVVGGTSLAGGRGGIGGTILGSIWIGTLFNGLNILGIGYEWQLVAIGVIIVLAVAADNLRAPQ